MLGLPGGVAKHISAEGRKSSRGAAEAVDFASSHWSFRRLVLGNGEYVDLIRSDAYTHQTYYMGMVDVRIE